MQEFHKLASNDNHFCDADFILRNRVTAELTYALAMFARDDGVP